MRTAKKAIKERPVFSRNLIKCRKEKGLSQEQLAELTGLSKRMVAYYELEAIKPPIDKIEIISKALNVSINDLLGTKDNSTIQNDFIQLDGKTLNKLKIILSLSPEDRHIVYTFAESLKIKREQAKKEKQDSKI